MKKLITLLLIIIPSLLFSQVRIYNDVAGLVTVEFSANNIKKYQSTNLSFYNVNSLIWMNRSINGDTEPVFRNQRFDSIKNESGGQLALTLSATLDSIAVIIASSPTLGETNTISNLGNGAEIYLQKIGADLQIKSLVSADSSIAIDNLGSELSIVRTHNDTGWADYVDTQYTSIAPFTVLEGTKVTLPNNAGSIVDPQKPTDISTFYDSVNRRITGRNGDGLLITIEFIVRPTSNAQTRVKTSIDIGGAIGEIYQRELFLTKGDGVDHFYLTTTNAYTLGTWEANGGEVLIEAIGGGVEIYGIRYVLARTHKAR